MCSGRAPRPFPRAFEACLLHVPRPPVELMRTERGSHLLRRTSKVSNILENIYLNLFTRKRLYKARFRFLEQKALIGIEECEQMQALTEEEAALRRFAKRAHALTVGHSGVFGRDRTAAFTGAGDREPWLRDRLWPGLTHEASHWGQRADELVELQAAPERFLQ